MPSFARHADGFSPPARTEDEHSNYAFGRRYCKPIRTASVFLMDLPASGHEPVLLDEILHLLAPAPGKTLVDCTLGRGGHAWHLAQRLGPHGLLIGLDVDPANLAFARERLADAPCRVETVQRNFTELPMVLRKLGIDAVDGILADLGISTNQLFDDEYGLSFQSDMPLDMRIDPRLGESAADVVNHWPEAKIADVLYELAQERYSRRIARKIVAVRALSPIRHTAQLAELVRSVVPRSGAAERIDPATRTFLALRMAVNREVPNLRSLLEQAPRCLRPAGRFAVVSFQSTEDREVKQQFRFAEQTGLLRVLTKKPITPSPAELQANPRARSSKLRVAEKP
jgi:16S rRNA (cytosine1402-N4)-methyltransferase